VCVSVSAARFVRSFFFVGKRVHQRVSGRGCGAVAVVLWLQVAVLITL